jgi:hypothetical protein
MKAQVVKFGAQKNGEVFAPGCLMEGVTVPVCDQFDGKKVVGSAVIHADGSADLTLNEGVTLATEIVGIGFRAEDWREEGGVRVVEEMRPICLGVKVADA